MNQPTFAGVATALLDYSTCLVSGVLFGYAVSGSWRVGAGVGAVLIFLEAIAKSLKEWSERID